MVLIAGIDEAGRGPVIGPMVIVGTLIDEVDEILLKSWGVKDSKKLSPIQRERLYEQIKTLVKDFRVKIIQPHEIDDAVEGDETNLNWLEADKTIEILNELKPKTAYIDCPSINIKAYREYLTKGLEELDAKNKKIRLVVEHKADERYIVTSAASIIAKTIREHEIKRIKEKYKIDFGSGYPSDPRTQEFAEKNYKKYPEIFRKSWGSYKNIVEKKKQRRLGEF